MGQDLVLYYNDSIDSDNWAGALALMRQFDGVANTSVVWILEPRQVSLGLSMTAEQRGKCLELIKAHFPGKGMPFKVLLGGLLEQADIDAIEGLSAEDRKLLHFAVKPKYGSKEDAVLHRRLTAWDQALCLNKWSSTGPVEVLMDVESLDRSQNPVNLNFHHQEELVGRSQEELQQFDTIMSQPIDQRRENLRLWYDECIERIEARKESQGTSVKALDFEALCDAINKADSVKFFGGASVDILQRFIQKGVASKIKVHVQVGSCDLSANLFPNQFNIALNPAAARYVFKNYKKFAHFAVVPSHTAQSVKYSLLGLTQAGGSDLGKRFLGFNCREEPMRIATKQVTLEKDYADKACPMPDLTTFLVALKPGFAGSTLSYAKVEDKDGTILFRKDTEGIPMYDISDSPALGEKEASLLWVE